MAYLHVLVQTQVSTLATLSHYITESHSVQYHYKKEYCLIQFSIGIYYKKVL